MGILGPGTGKVLDAEIEVGMLRGWGGWVIGGGADRLSGVDLGGGVTGVGRSNTRRENNETNNDAVEG